MEQLVTAIGASQAVVDVHYSIRGPLANRALELEQDGHDIIKLILFQKN